MKRAIIAGESWMKQTTHIKGFDIFTTCEYEEGVEWIRNALIHGGWDVVHIPGHKVCEVFPSSIEELVSYDVVILSDIGSNSLLLSSATFNRSQIVPDRCEVLREYVLLGGGLIMIGGYMSFSGIDAKARYGVTPLADVLPVKMLDVDDRIEKPNGIQPKVLNSAHPVMAELGDWPRFLGYNRTIEIPEGQVLAKFGEDPFIAVRDSGKGRTAVFTSDCAPHWGPPEFVNWINYGLFWNRLLNWVARN